MKTVFYWIVIALIICSSSQTALAQNREVVDRIIATVNGEIITQFEVDAAIRPVLKRLEGKAITPEQREQLKKLRDDVIERDVQHILLKQEADNYGITVTEDAVAEAIKDFKQRNKLDDDQFEAQLKGADLTLEEFKKRMRDDIRRNQLLAHMVRQKVVVTADEIDAEMTKRFGSVKERFLTLRIILLPPGQSAADLRERIEDGDISFSEAADTLSVGPGAGSGGDFGEVAWGDLSPQWREALRNLEANGVSQPQDFDGKSGLLQLVSSREGVSDDAQKKRDEIAEDLRNKKLEKVFEEYMKSLRDKAVIVFK